MAYHCQGHILTDKRKTIQLSDLIKWGYIHPGIKADMTYSWTRGGQTMGRIGISMQIFVNTGRLILDYNINGEHVNYSVDLITKPANIPNGGLVWFMVCKQSGKLCRKLYFNGKYFVHREEVSGMYEIQTMSRKGRDIEKLFGDYFNRNDIYNELMKKHAKKQYAGKVTKRHARLLQRKEVAESISLGDYEKLLIFGHL